MVVINILLWTMNAGMGEDRPLLVIEGPMIYLFVMVAIPAMGEEVLPELIEEENHRLLQEGNTGDSMPMSQPIFLPLRKRRCIAMSSSLPPVNFLLFFFRSGGRSFCDSYIRGTYYFPAVPSRPHM